MEIRQIILGDAKKFLEMLLQLDHESKNMMYEEGERPGDIHVMIERIKEAADKDNLLLGIFEAGEVMGFLSADRGEFNRNKHTAYVVIGILEKGKHKGMGHRLFDELMVWAKNRNIVRLELTVMCHNDAAVALYKKYGFVIEGIKKYSLLVEGNYIDEYYMAKVMV